MQVFERILSDFALLCPGNTSGGGDTFYATGRGMGGGGGGIHLTVQLTLRY